MSDHHNLSSLLEQPHEAVPFFETVLVQTLAGGPACKNPRYPGPPRELSLPPLWFAPILGILQGGWSYQGIPRLIAPSPMRPFAPVTLTDDTIFSPLKPACIH